MATTIARNPKKELAAMQAKLARYAPYFDSEKRKMELSLMLDPPVTVRTLQTYFAGKGKKFSFTQELLETVERVVNK